MESGQVAPLLSLFGGVDELAAERLGVVSIRHWSAVRKLSKSPPASFEGSAFVAELFSRVSTNWDRCLAVLDRQPSRENWRWFDPKCEMSAHNPSKEVTLERAIVGAAEAQGRKDWSNQVPIGSGLIARGGDRRRAVDLVHRREPDAFDLVELKVESDNPLYAAIEILRYGFAWLLSRQHQAALGYSDRTLIQASDVRLSVLAPYQYYRDLSLGWLSDGLAEGLQSLGDRHGVRLTFAFESFPESFVWPGTDPALALSALDNRLRR
jgi:hypothetical protein